jgi:hypothetical protein
MGMLGVRAVVGRSLAGLGLALFVAAVAPRAAAADTAAMAAAQLDLERRKVEIEEGRFALEQQRLAMDRQAAAGKRWVDPLGPLLAGLIALVTIPLTFVTTRWNERRKVREELAIANDQDLRKERLAAYKTLWGSLEPLALYAHRRMSYDDLPAMSETLRGWYFGGGGMFMTETTRERYFAIQHGLDVVWTRAARVDRKALLQATLTSKEAKDDENRYQAFTAGDELPAVVDADDPGVAYRFLRALGSRLRWSMTADLGTRARLG